MLCKWTKRLGVTVIDTVDTEEKAALARVRGCDYPIVHTCKDFAAPEGYDRRRRRAGGLRLGRTQVRSWQNLAFDRHS